jgi:hypothetical protein
MASNWHHVKASLVEEHYAPIWQVYDRTKHLKLDHFECRRINPRRKESNIMTLWILTTPLSSGSFVRLPTREKESIHFSTLKFLGQLHKGCNSKRIVSLEILRPEFIGKNQIVDSDISHFEFW